MSKANLGWLFYRKMYKNGNDDYQIKETMNNLTKVNGSDEKLNAKESFKLKTLYPGLLVGSGYTHGLSSDYDSKIGFYFDHTTGLPLIQGSSVKGLLRSCFGLEFGSQTDVYKNEKHTLIRDLLKKPDIDVDALAKEIFEGIDPETEKPKSIYQRDVFYEARVIETEGILIQDDYITHHGEDLLKNPTPLRFIKVAPNVMFEFSFDLKDTTLLTAKEKRELFIQLLEMFGIGAKTNVGYGQFEVVLTQEEIEERQKEEEAKVQAEKEAKEKADQEAKDKAEGERLAKEESLKKEKEAKKSEGLNALLDCKTLADGFKLLKDSFGKKPKPSSEEKVIIEQFKKKFNKLSKGDIKTLSKYGV